MGKNKKRFKSNYDIDMLKNIVKENYNTHIVPLDQPEIKIPLIESIPESMRNRVYSIEQDTQGNITIYFDIYFGDGERK